MTLAEIYQRFQVPPNVIRHIAEVAVVCQFLLDHWTGPEKVDHKLVIDAALVHDLANIIKFKRPFKGELESDGDYWQKVQDDMVARYGSDVHEALLQMIREIKLDRMLPIFNDMVDMYTRDYGNNQREFSTEAQILELADCCVAPEGIVGFNIRMQDLYQRYNFDEEDAKAQCLIANKDWVQARIDVDLEQVDWGKVREKVGRFDEYEIIES